MLQDRLKERFIDYESAFKRLKEASDKKIYDDIVIDAVIQRFEFTFELSWKLMKMFLEYEGLMEEANSPRTTIKAAFKAEIIEDGDKWIEMMLDRNRTSHIYDETVAKGIYMKIKNEYIVLLEKLMETMKQKI